MERRIFHVDVNSAFLSWESARRVRQGLPDLRQVPSIVGGNPENRTSVVLAKSISAKQYGILTGEPVSSALRKCPDLEIVPSDFALYSRCSRAFKNICRQYAPVVEEFSIDECFLDMTGTSRLYPDLLKTAAELKDRIRETLGFTVNVGVSSNKMLAKMASDFEKPDKVHTLFPEEIVGKMWPLPVGELFLCGKASSEKLKTGGIHTIGDLARSDTSYVQSILGKKQGVLLHNYANGIDDSPVVQEPEAPKGYSNEVTFEDDIVTYESADRVLLFLCDSVAARIRRDHRTAACISVTIRGNDRKKHSHQRNFGTGTDITNDIYTVSKELLRELWDGRQPLRLMGVALTELNTDDYLQASIFDDAASKEKAKKADQMMDAVRNRFGHDLLKRGSMLGDEVRVRRH